MKELERYYQILELQSGANLEEINEAYRDLVFVWHPDRIPYDNLRLQKKAQQKLQDINEAREKLRLYKLEHEQYYCSQQRECKPFSSREKIYSPSTSYKAEPYKKDLSGKNFSRANLCNKDLSGRNLSYADLSRADLSDAFMHKAVLRGANLSEANLLRANLLLADLREVNLRSANLIGADLSGADLSGANLSGARIRSGSRLIVKLIGTKLSGTIMPDGRVYS